MRLDRYIQTLLLLLMFSSGVKAFQTSGPEAKRQVQAVKLGDRELTQFRFDGYLDEPFWNTISPVTGFTQTAPIEGAPATEQTEVRIAYDSKYIYIGVMLYDSDPSQIKAFQKRRDQRLVADDRFVWIFDTFNDQRNAYFMEINPNGLRTDALVSTGQGNNVNINWDGIWDARTQIGDEGWSAEIRIPFSTLNFDEDSDRWGVNFSRVIRRKNETVMWTGYRRNQGIFRPQDAGIMTGLEGMTQGLGLEVVPFGIMNANKDHSIPNTDTEINPDAGIDINYSITPSLKASLTFNTDFAEAEVDQRQVNLTRFPLFFPERRDFFLEGSNTYSFAPSSGINPYFSRRIGLSGGSPIPITYGARLLGNAGAYNMALLQVRTGESGSNPAENFSVARVRRNIGEESTVGMIYTRRATEDNGTATMLQDRHTFGTDLELGTSRFLGDKNLQFQAFFVFHNPSMADDDSSTVGDRSSRGFRLNFPNQPWSGHVSYREFGNAFDPAVGFTPRIAFRRFQPSVDYAPQFPNSDLIQQVQWGIRFEHLMDLDFNLLTQQLVFNLGEVGFSSGDQIGISVDRQYELLTEPFDIRRDGSIILPVDEYVNWGAEVELRTAAYRKVSANVEFEFGEFWSGTSTAIEAGLTLRPYSGIELTPSYSRNNVYLPQGDFQTDLFRFEGNIDFTTSLFLTVNLQYDNLSDLIGMNNRLRWIITPGSDLYLVYTHNWLENQLGQFETYQQAGVVKLSYTHRF